MAKNSTSPTTSAASSESGSIASSAYQPAEPLIPEAILQSAGRPLQDVIVDVRKIFY